MVIGQKLYSRNYLQEESLLKTDSSSANQGILHDLWKERFHYRVSKNLPVNLTYPKPDKSSPQWHSLFPAHFDTIPSAPSYPK
jgi:hypothetical protein